MQEVIKIFREIQETSSLNQKKTIIAANKDNELFKRCLVFLLDTNITTGIAESKIKKFAERTCLALSSVQLSSRTKIMNYLSGVWYSYWTPTSQQELQRVKSKSLLKERVSLYQVFSFLLLKMLWNI